MKTESRTLWLLLCIVLGCVQPLNAQQTHERIVRTVSWSNEPLKIVAARVKGKPVELNQKFLADDDWFCGLTISIMNKSAMEIIYFDIGLTITRPKNSSDAPVFSLLKSQGPSLWFPASHPEPLDPLKPGETRDIELLWNILCDKYKEDLSKYGYPAIIDQIEVNVEDIGFVNDLSWQKGEMLRLESKNPNVWRIIGP